MEIDCRRKTVERWPWKWWLDWWKEVIRGSCFMQKLWVLFYTFMWHLRCQQDIHVEVCKRKNLREGLGLEMLFYKHTWWQSSWRERTIDYEYWKAINFRVLMGRREKEQLCRWLDKGQGSVQSQQPEGRISREQAKCHGGRYPWDWRARKDFCLAMERSFMIWFFTKILN